MNHDPINDPRRLAVRFCGVVILGIVCLFAWAAVLSFDVADPPNAAVAPQNSPPANWGRQIGAHLAYAGFYYLGIGVYPLLGLLSGAVLAWSRGWRSTHAWIRFLGAALVAASVATAGELLLDSSDGWLITGPGGAVGYAAGLLLLPQVGVPGMFLLAGCGVVVGLLIAADEAMIRFIRWSADMTARSGPTLARAGRDAWAQAGAAVGAVATGVSSASQKLATAGAALGAAQGEADEAPRGRPGRQLPLELPEIGEELDDDEDLAPIQSQPEAPAPPAPRARSAARSAPGAAVEAGDSAVQERALTVKKMEPKAPSPRETAAIRTEVGDYHLPPITLLEEPEPIDKNSIELLCREKAMILEQTLNEFRLEVTVASIETGPVITVFELKLAPGIKVSQIASLTNDMARALRAPAVRVVAPLPGRNTVGIEVPNLDKEKVRVKDLMRKAAKRTEGYCLPLYLGKDASGQPLISDLTKMPHLLIAGTTGSGKSVCVSSIILSMLLTRTPDEVQMIMVDPKVVELSMFKDIPHLMCPIVTEMSKAEAILDWAATKMDERYALLAEAGVKDILSYNALGEAGLRERMGIQDDAELEQIPVYMPYIVILIDELADLMMTSAKEVEFYLCRLAQKSRAVGIHLIVSTQRPQANVVTGLIKSNLPCRIAFRVSSRLDSRIVLDQNGGEVLMGQGDMLFLPPGSSKLVRAQGTYIADDELRRIVRHCKQQRAPQFSPELMRPARTGDGGGERDELFDQAVDAILASGRGSVSLLQRKLTIGYGRASRLIDQMYEAGIVGEYKGSQAREILVTEEEWAAMRGMRDREEAAEAAQNES